MVDLAKEFVMGWRDHFDVNGLDGASYIFLRSPALHDHSSIN